MPIDLTGKSFSIAQSIIDKGQELKLDFSVMNNGDEDAAPFSFDIVISKDDEISEDDYKIGYYDIVNGLEAGKATNLKSFEYNTPDKDSSFWKDEDGSYTVGIRIDPNDQFVESNEDNNSNVESGIDFDTVDVQDFDFIYKDNRAELKGSFVDVANEAITPGEAVDISFTVDNESPAPAQPFSVDIYLSPAKGIGVAEAVKLGTYDIRDRTAGNGDTGVKSFTYTTPDLGNAVWGKGDGEYFIALDIDSKDEVAETREGNNSRQGDGLDYTTFGVTGLNSEADLVVKSFSVPENAKPGETVAVEYEIVNEGESKADLFAAGFYLFDEDYLADSDSLDVGDVPEVVFSQGNGNSSLLNLEPGASTGVVTDEITLPESWDGYSGSKDYYIGIEADPFDDVVESNDANNSLTEEMVDYQKITLEDVVDLKNVSFNVESETIDTGSAFEVSYEIMNDGTESADLFGAGFFVFTEDYLMNHDGLAIEDAPEVYFSPGSDADALMSLEPGATTGTAYTELTIPEEWAGFSGGSGDYYVGFAADPYGDIAETNEMNNSLSGMNMDYQKVYINVNSIDV